MRPGAVNTLLKATVVLLFGGAFFCRCANIVSPQGGPRDSLPPIVVAASPMFYSTNMNEKKILLTFNEYIQIKDQQKEFFTSPDMKHAPKLLVKGKTLQITITDTLDENRTYSLNFGSAIRDNNESNPLGGLRYVFSTGKEIDSLFMSGYTVSASKGDSVGRTIIYFYPAEVDSIPQYDSTLLKSKPAAIARAETNGIFIAQNLQPVNYRVYAFEDKNNNWKYDPETDQVGFLDSIYNPLSMPDFTVRYDTTRKYLVADPQLYFKMFGDRRFRRQVLTSQERPLQRKVTLMFGAANPEIRRLWFEGIDSTQVITQYLTRGRDTINYWLNVADSLLPDTIRGGVVYLKHDSINNLVPDTAKLQLVWRYIESKEEKKSREEEEKKRAKAERDSTEYVAPVKPNPFKVDISRGEINPNRGMDLKFSYPIVAADTSLFELSRINVNDKGEPTDTLKVGFDFRRDTVDMMTWHLNTKWSPGSKYTVMIPSGAIENVARERNDTLKSDVTVFSPDKFGLLKVDVVGKTPESRYVLYLREESGKTIEERRDVTTGKYTFEYIKPGKIRLAVLEDLNANGLWDTGNLIERRQPERTEVYVSTTGDEIMEAKAGWEVEITADMNNIFAPITYESVKAQLAKMESARLKKLAEERAKREREKNQKGEKSGGMGGIGAGLGGLKSGVGSLTK